MAPNDIQFKLRAKRSKELSYEYNWIFFSAQDTRPWNDTVHIYGESSMHPNLPRNVSTDTARTLQDQPWCVHRFMYTTVALVYNVINLCFREPA